MTAIFKRELRSYFTGAIGYVFLFIFLAVGAVVFSYTTLFSMSSDVTNFYLIMMIFSGVMLPLLTMKSFSEERKLKTEQLLLTAPISLTGMVLGKFFAALVMFAGALTLSSLSFLFLIPYAQIKFAVLLGNYTALILVGTCFLAIGVFVSSFTENQLAAAVGTIAIILAFLGIGIVNSLLPSSYWLRYVFDCLSIFSRFQNFTAGFFDFASVLYYLSVAFVFLYLTVRGFDRRRYR